MPKAESEFAESLLFADGYTFRNVETLVADFLADVRRARGEDE